MISHRYKCIFIHIPKCAGTSIEKNLGLFDKLQRGQQDHRAIREIEPFSLNYVTNIFSPNIGVYWLAKRFKNIFKNKATVSQEQYSNYYKFTIVRNSWSRVFSWYTSVMRDELHKKELGMSGDCTFKDFLNKHMNQWALKSQIYWIADHQGEIPMDFIGRFEDLNKDFNMLANTLQLPDKELPRLNIGKGSHYSEAYDEEMKNIVARIYKDEIALFNFKFGE